MTTTPVRTIVDKPWGHEEILAHVPGKYCMKRLHVNGGTRLSLQYHAIKDETMLLESGDAYLLIGGTLASLERRQLTLGEPVRITAWTMHRLCAETDTVVLEVSTPELSDVVRLDDDYHR